MQIDHFRPEDLGADGASCQHGFFLDAKVQLLVQLIGKWFQGKSSQIAPFSGSKRKEGRKECGRRSKKKKRREEARREVRREGREEGGMHRRTSKHNSISEGLTSLTSSFFGCDFEKEKRRGLDKDYQEKNDNFPLLLSIFPLIALLEGRVNGTHGLLRYDFNVFLPHV